MPVNFFLLSFRQPLVCAHRKTCRLDTGLFALLSAFEPVGIAQAPPVFEGVALLVLLVVVPHRGLTSANTLCPKPFIVYSFK